MDSLLSGVSGLQSFQSMLDVAGNNLANVNTTGFKSSSVDFSELLGTTLKEASEPTASQGGTDPIEIGSGVQVASINRNMTQGTLTSTGQPLDMAIDGSGYFVLNNGTGDVYTRAGAFGVDSNNYLVDPSTGYRVQRIGSDGMANNFQSASNSDIQIPYGASLPAKATTTMSFTGNLSADESSPTTNVLTSGVTYTASGADATASTLLSSLDQATNLTSGDKIVISGTTASGTIVGPTDFDIFTSGDTPTCKTVGNLVSAIQAAFPDTDVSLNNGQITVTDNSSGYSQTAVNLKFSGGDDDSLTVPGDLSVTTPGGNDTMTTSMDVYDSQGVAHTVDASFVKTNTPNTWDLVCSSISGDATITQGRIDGITFGADGSFSSVTQANPSLQFQFPSEGSSATSTVSLNFGTAGGFNGVSQLAGSSTIALSSQDGYASGTLSSMSVNQDGEPHRRVLQRGPGRYRPTQDRHVPEPRRAQQRRKQLLHHFGQFGRSAAFGSPGQRRRLYHRRLA